MVAITRRNVPIGIGEGRTITTGVKKDVCIRSKVLAVNFHTTIDPAGEANRNGYAGRKHNGGTGENALGTFFRTRIGTRSRTRRGKGLGGGFGRRNRLGDTFRSCFRGRTAGGGSRFAGRSRFRGTIGNNGNQGPRRLGGRFGTTRKPPGRMVGNRSGSAYDSPKAIPIEERNFYDLARGLGMLPNRTIPNVAASARTSRNNHSATGRRGRRRVIRSIPGMGEATARFFFGGNGIRLGLGPRRGRFGGGFGFANRFGGRGTTGTGRVIRSVPGGFYGRVSRFRGRSGKAFGLRFRSG